MRVTAAEVFLYKGGLLWVDIGWLETPGHPYHRAAGADPKPVADGSWISKVTTPAPKGIAFPKIGLRANTPDDSHWGENEAWLDYRARKPTASRANALEAAISFFDDFPEQTQWITT